MEAIEDIQRALHWPEVGETGIELRATMQWLRKYQAKHAVYLPQTHFSAGRGGMQDWLEQRFGPAMIQRRLDTGYMWTNGRWVSMVRMLMNRPDGRDYLFIREDEAFEFKMVWG